MGSFWGCGEGVWGILFFFFCLMQRGFRDRWKGAEWWESIDGFRGDCLMSESVCRPGCLADETQCFSPCCAVTDAFLPRVTAERAGHSRPSVGLRGEEWMRQSMITPRLGGNSFDRLVLKLCPSVAHQLHEQTLPRGARRKAVRDGRMCCATRRHVFDAPCVWLKGLPVKHRATTAG